MDKPKHYGQTKTPEGRTLLPVTIIPGTNSTTGTKRTQRTSTPEGRTLWPVTIIPEGQTLWLVCTYTNLFSLFLYSILNQNSNTRILILHQKDILYDWFHQKDILYDWMRMCVIIHLVCIYTSRFSSGHMMCVVHHFMFKSLLYIISYLIGTNIHLNLNMSWSFIILYIYLHCNDYQASWHDNPLIKIHLVFVEKHPSLSSKKIFTCAMWLFGWYGIGEVLLWWYYYWY